ncbi:uridine kinase family protein [Reichenbachiella ulvae]|uniref:Uridine kinase n=1 Tax=Reichenbachiella ulvae TaxID=2980104 RepID=A0ABT3D074_9BACT|nr:uridine kinase [Reichenbachiella ulvae]MCV9389350.1 uridine kinase [Reichenbachiella ulvae]
MSDSNSPYVVGICGGTASGKTKLLSDLQNSFEPDQISVLSLDNYYRDIEEQYVDEGGVEDFDRPSSIDLLAFAEDLKKLKNGESVRRKEYTFNNPDAEIKYVETKAAPIIIVEGIFIFHEAEIRNQIDLKVFVETQIHLAMKRRIKRDAIERNYDLDDVLYRFEHHVMPAYQQYIEPYKTMVDLIVPNNGSNFDTAKNVIQSFLRTRLK